ncbi:MAG: hypothetical protein ABI327_00930 [Burkholderiaceae bacterium]
MKTTIFALACACIALATGSAAAQDATKKNDSMGMEKDPTMQQCKDHIAKAEKEGLTMHNRKPGDPAMRMDKICADMMKNDSSVKKDMPAEPMKK